MEMDIKKDNRAPLPTFIALNLFMKDSFVRLKPWGSIKSYLMCTKMIKSLASLWCWQIHQINYFVKCELRFKHKDLSSHTVTWETLSYQWIHYAMSWTVGHTLYPNSHHQLMYTSFWDMKFCVFMYCLLGVKRSRYNLDKSKIFV